MLFRLRYQRQSSHANHLMLGMSKGIESFQMEKEKNQKDVFQQHRCLHINDCQVSKKLINLDSEAASIGLPPFCSTAKTRSPQTMQEFTRTGPATRSPLHTYMVTNQSRADKCTANGAAANIHANHSWQSTMINLLVRKTSHFQKRWKYLWCHSISWQIDSCLILTCLDVYIAWCTMMH